MSKAGDHQAPQKAPPMQVLLRPSCFSESLEGRPRETVKVGLRRATADELLNAHLEAAKKADEYHPDHDRTGMVWQTTYQTLRFHYILGYVLTDEEDVTETPAFWDFQDGSVMIGPSPTGQGVVSRFFTRDGLGRLYDALELLTLKDNPTWPLATNVQIENMIDQIDEGTFFTSIAPGEGPGDPDAQEERRLSVERQIRRLLGYVIHLHDTGFAKPIVY